MRSFVKRSWASLVVSGALLAPTVLRAAEEGGEHEAGNPWLGLVWKFVNFGILAGGLFYVLRKTVAQALVDRQEAVRRALQEAKDAKDAAEAKYQEYKDKVARLDEESRTIHESFRTEGERQRDRIVREAEAQAASIRQQAEVAGSNEVKRATDELRAELADMAVRLAEEILTKAYTAEDQKKAVQQTIENFERIH